MKKNIGPYPFVYPTPIAIVGVRHDGKINFTEIGDCGIMGISPPLVYISLHEDHLSTDMVHHTGAFSINFPATGMIQKTDYCGIYSGKDRDKSDLFNISEGPENVPMIDDCPVSIVCGVCHTAIIEKRHIFISEVIKTFMEESLFQRGDDGNIRFEDLSAFDPLLYGLDNRYYKIGESIGVGYKEGRGLRP